jgi:hypothetical protein
MVREQLILFPAGEAMQVPRNPVVKKVTGLIRRKARAAQKRKDASVVVPDETALSTIFADNAETARKNLDRFAPRI